MEQETPWSVDVEKGSGGIGFSLEGGRGSIQGDRPLVINRIFKGTLISLSESDYFVVIRINTLFTDDP